MVCGEMDGYVGTHTEAYGASLAVFRVGLDKVGKEAARKWDRKRADGLVGAARGEGGDQHVVLGRCEETRDHSFPIFPFAC